jgi:hypothetical protein
LEYERVFKSAEKFSYAFRCSAKTGQYNGKDTFDFQVDDVVSKEEIANKDEPEEQAAEAAMDSEPAESDAETTLESNESEEGEGTKGSGKE